MELSQLTNNSHASSIVNTANTIKTNDIQSNEEITKKYPEDKIEVNQTAKTSELAENISSNISKIANLQKAQVTISAQLEITSEIVKTTNSANDSSSIQLDDKQPAIKKHMDDFNTLSEGFKKPEISDEIGIYFDGKVGAKPLSSGEILDASAEQQERLTKFSQNIANEIDSILSQTKNTIATEQTEIETKVEFKVNYEQASQQFDTSTLSNIQGNFLPSQANAIPFHSEKLLA